jgi:tetratricopeptide (TPR) repeat protein
MKRTVLLAGLLALSACADSPAESLAKAKVEFAAHDYATARIHIAAALEADPNNAELLLLQAKTLIAMGDGHGAATTIDRITAGKTPSGALAELAAEAALLRKVPETALQLLGDAKTAEAERLRALAALQKSDVKAAQDHLEKAAALGGNARAYADYARLRLMSGDIAGANEMAAKAAKAEPDGIDTLLVEGQLALRRGDLRASLDKYSRAGQLYPNSLAALTGRAAVLGDLGRIKEMNEAIARAEASAPRDPAVLFLKAKSASLRKDWGTVRAIIQPIEAGLGQLDPMRQLYGQALLRLGQAEQAIAQIKPIAGAMPNNRDAQLLLGEAQIASGDPVSALEILGPLARQPGARPDELALAALAAREARDPSATEFETMMHQPAVKAIGRDIADADAAMRAGNWGGAAASYQRVLDLTDGRNVMVLNNMAYAQTMLGNHEAALGYAGKAMKLAPNNPSVLDTAGWAQFKSGKGRDEALRLLRRAAQLAPKNVTIRAHLAEAERTRN